jgi:hypothetical protein
VIEMVHLLGLAGLTLVVTRGALLSRVRRLAPKLLTCPQCVGWHLGFWLTGLSMGLSERTFTWPSAFSLIGHAMLVGGVVSLLASLAEGTLATFDEVVLKLQGKSGATPGKPEGAP